MEEVNMGGTMTEVGFFILFRDPPLLTLSSKLHLLGMSRLIFHFNSL